MKINDALNAISQLLGNLLSVTAESLVRDPLHWF